MYTRHTSRMIIFYLLSLPLALDGVFKSSLSVLFTVFAVTFYILGLDEINMQIEQPFRRMPMQPLAEAVLMDVADSFVCRPTDLKGNGKGVKESGLEKPEYWNGDKKGKETKESKESKESKEQGGGGVGEARTAN